jgi:hypothetical protein
LLYVLLYGVAAGIELGAYDHRMMIWLLGGDLETVPS